MAKRVLVHVSLLFYFVAPPLPRMLAEAKKSPRSPKRKLFLEIIDGVRERCREGEEQVREGQEE
eukprot:25019-Pyramimonas_sp.AAC.1